MDTTMQHHLATQLLPTIGHPLEGGFYGGIIRIADRQHAIVHAPKALGEITGIWHPKHTDIQGATSCCDSMANTLAMAEAGSPIAQQALAASIGGFRDWCIAARDVVELAYRHLKPTDQANWASYRDGDNPSSVPVGYPYTNQCPAQTMAEAFRPGGPEAFETDRYYYSSTQYSQSLAWVQNFYDGNQYIFRKDDSRRVRFVRLIQLDA